MMSSKSFYICICVIAIVATSASARGKPSRSTCREPIIFQNFDSDRFVGSWYIHSHHDHEFEHGCDCFTSEVVRVMDTDTFQISNCCQMTRVSNETQMCDVSVNGVRIPNPEKREAFFFYTRKGVSVESNVWIIDTDYENYMIVDGCERVSDDEEREVFWILTRSSVVDKMITKKIDNVLNVNHFERNKIVKQRHGADICKSKRPEHGNHHHGNHGHGKGRGQRNQKTVN